jgi:hypothetical protein
LGHDAAYASFEPDIQNGHPLTPLTSKPIPQEFFLSSSAFLENVDIM